MTELLSVVVPTYQRPERLATAARSVLDQDYRAIELVIVDDGSAAPTVRAIDELAAGDRRVVVVRHDRPLGASAARNTGLAAAQGDLIAFCDDDDIWLPGAASAAVAALRPPIGVVYGWHQVFHESNGRCVTFRPPPVATPSLMRWINVPAILSGVARRATVGDALTFDPTLHTSEDWDLWLRCADRAPMSLVPVPLYRYVQHPGDRVTRQAAHVDGRLRFLEKHRSTMSRSCIAHHELIVALNTRDQPGGLGRMARLCDHPANLGAVLLLAGEITASQIGIRRADPGLPLRSAANLLGAGAALSGSALSGSALSGSESGSPSVSGTPGEGTGGGDPTPQPPAPAGTPPGEAGRARSRSRPPVSALWGWAQLAMGRSATDRLVEGSALVLSPHPDDETIGCSLLIAEKVRRGHPVAVAVATDGRAGWYSSTARPDPDAIVDIRHHEWHRALDALQVPVGSRFELGFPDGELSDHECELAVCIGDLLASLRPAQVFVTRPDDPHADHRALARAARRAVAEVGDGSPELFTYRVYPAAGLWPGGHPARPTLATTLVQLGRRSVIDFVHDRPLVLRDPGSTPAKQAAVAAHTSQRQLLDGELRYVWGTGVELFRPMDGSG